MLTQSFRNYISADEKRVIDQCLAGDMQWDDKDEMDQLLEVLSNYDCRSKVNSENIVHIIEEIAHKELLQKLQYIADCWKDIVCRYIFNALLLSFWLYITIIFYFSFERILYLPRF